MICVQSLESQEVAGQLLVCTTFIRRPTVVRVSSWTRTSHDPLFKAALQELPSEVSTALLKNGLESAAVLQKYPRYSASELMIFLQSIPLKRRHNAKCKLVLETGPDSIDSTISILSIPSVPIPIVVGSLERVSEGGSSGALTHDVAVTRFATIAEKFATVQSSLTDFSKSCLTMDSHSGTASSDWMSFSHAEAPSSGTRIDEFPPVSHFQNLEMDSHFSSASMMNNPASVEDLSSMDDPSSLQLPSSTVAKSLIEVAKTLMEDLSVVVVQSSTEHIINKPVMDALSSVLAQSSAELEVPKSLMEGHTSVTDSGLADSLVKKMQLDVPSPVSKPGSSTVT